MVACNSQPSNLVTLDVKRLGLSLNLTDNLESSLIIVLAIMLQPSIYGKTGEKISFDDVRSLTFYLLVGKGSRG